MSGSPSTRLSAMPAIRRRRAYFGKNHVRTVFVLKISRPAVMVGVPVRNNDVFDICRIETELSQPFVDRFLDAIVEARVVQDDAL